MMAEAQAAAGVDHPNVVKIHAAGRAHDGRIVTDAPDVMWGTDGMRVETVEGWVWIFVAVEHWNGEVMGWHVTPKGDRFAALAVVEDVSQQRAADKTRNAVIGLPDDTWGEAVSAAVVLKNGTLELGELRDWCKGRLSVYKIPQRLKVVSELPRNAMGKVTKPAVVKMLGRG